jgi:hypothetical protein
MFERRRLLTGGLFMVASSLLASCVYAPDYDDGGGRGRGRRQRRYFDADNNPPGRRGGWDTNWENPPGPRGGPGASPDRW